MNKFSLKIFLLLVISSMILGFVVFQVITNIKEFVGYSAQIDRSNQFLIKLSDVVVDTQETQNLARNYLITGDKQHLVKYKLLLATIEGDLGGLASNIGDDSQQRERVNQLATLVHARAGTLETIVAKAASRGSMLASLRASVSAESNNAMVGLIGEIKATEQGKLADTRERNNNGLMTTITVSAVGIGTCIAIFLFLFWLIDREGQRRTRNEQSLHAMVTRMERIQQEMREMNSLADYLQSCREMEEIYSLVARHLSAMFPNLHGVLGVYSNSRNVVEIVTSWGGDPVPASEEGKYFLPDDCWALRRGSVHEAGGARHGLHCTHATHNTGHTICFPMGAQGEIIGVLYITAVNNATIDPHVMQPIRSISEQVSMAIANMRLEKTLRMQSLRDPLTQLYNRRYMETSLDREVFRAKRKKEPVSIIMIDIDHFKRFNDHFGHEAGDFVLKEFSKLLLQFIRGEDIACRYGGEEFILILPGASLAIALARAEKLRATMEKTPLSFNGVTLDAVTLSLGVITYPEHCDDPAVLVKKADEALYRAKHAGRNRVEVAWPGAAATA